MLRKVTHCAGCVSANTSCAGVTGRWGLPYHAQNAVRWLACHTLCVLGPCGENHENGRRAIDSKPNNISKTGIGKGLHPSGDY